MAVYTVTLCLSLGAEPASHIPIHQPGRHFFPKDIREAVTSSQELAPYRGLAQKLQNDPEMVKRMVGAARAMGITPEKAKDFAKNNPLFKSFAEKLQNSEFQRKLIADPEIQKAARRLADNPEVRDFLQEMAGQTKGSDIEDLVRSQPGLQGLKNEFNRRMEQRSSSQQGRRDPSGNRTEQTDNSQNRNNDGPPGQNSRGESQGRNGNDPANEWSNQGGRPGENGSVATRPGRQTPSEAFSIREMLPNTEKSGSRIIQDAIRQVKPERFINGLLTARDSVSEDPESSLLAQSRSLVSTLSQRTKGLRKWGANAATSVRQKLPPIPKIPIPNVRIPKWSVPAPKVPSFRVPQLGLPTGGASGLGTGLFVVLALVATGVFLAIWSRRFEGGPASLLLSTMKRRSRVPRGDDDRSKICNLFEAEALQLLGESARPLHHQEVADRLKTQRKTRGDTIRDFAHLYELARYSPENESLNPDSLEKARQYSAALHER